MSIPGPLDLNTQLVTSSFTGETDPHNIILKDTMWVIFNRNNNIRIREYNGTRIDPDVLTNNINQFTISNALDNFGVISLTKFLLWTIEDNNLYVTEIEPFIEKSPIIGIKTLFLNDINTVNVNVFKNNEINIVTLDTSTDFGQKLSFKTYPNINLPTNFSKTLDWGNGNFDGSREFNNIGMFKDINNNELSISYSKSGSPLNINLDNYTFIVLPINTNIIGNAKISAIIVIEAFIPPPFIITVIPTIGFVGDEILITSIGFFDSLNPNSNLVYFGNIIAEEVTIIDTLSLKVIVPNGAVSDYIHLQVNNNISNYVFFEVPYPDDHFPDKVKARSKFDSDIGRSPIYNRDIGITNFTEIVDENSIVQNVYNILLTRPGERLFNSNFGCYIHNKVFDLIDDVNVTEKEVLSIINDSLNNFEPRAILLKDQSFINFREDDNALDIVLAIRIPNGIIKEIAISIGKGIKSA